MIDFSFINCFSLSYAAATFTEGRHRSSTKNAPRFLKCCEDSANCQYGQGAWRVGRWKQNTYDGVKLFSRLYFQTVTVSSAWCGPYPRSCPRSWKVNRSAVPDPTVGQHTLPQAAREQSSCLPKLYATGSS